MTVSVCLKRQGYVKKVKKHAGYYRVPVYDPGCENCEQWERNAKKIYEMEKK
jgi:hypothetical protein